MKNNQSFRIVLSFILLAALFAAMPGVGHAAFQATDAIGQRRGGSPVFSINGANNTPNDIGVNGPKGVAIDTVGRRLFLSDQANRRILVYPLTAAGLLATTTPSHVLGAPDAFTSGTSTLGAASVDASGLAYDPVSNRLFAAEANNRVLVFNVATSTIANFEPASYVLGQPDFTTTGGDISSSTIGSAVSVAYDSGNQRLFVGDSFYRRVLVFNVATSTIANGKGASYVLGHQDFTTQTEASMSSSTFADAGSSNGPSALAYDSVANRLFAMQGGANRVLVFNVATSTIANGMGASYVLGQADFNSSGSDTTSSTLTEANGSAGLGYDATGNRLFVSDGGNNRVLVFNVATSTIANGKGASYVLGQTIFTAGASGMTSSTLSGPGFISYNSAADKLVVVDQSNNRALFYDTATITNGEGAVDVLGHVVNGQKSFVFGGSDNGPGPSGFQGSGGMALDTTAHRLFVADTDNNRVIAFNLNSNDDFSDYDADYVIGQPDMYTETAGASSVKMTTPRSVAVDTAGRRLFVSEAENNRVLVFDISTANIANGMAASNVLGQPDFDSSGQGATTTAKVFTPMAVTYDSVDKRLFVADQEAGRILIFNAATSSLSDYMAANKVLGKSSFALSSGGSSAGANTSSTLYNPKDVTYDAANSRLFVSEGGFNRVMVWDVATSTVTNGRPASYVLGHTTFTATSAGTTSSTLRNPEGLTYDAPHKRLFVADTDNNRVLGFTVTPANMRNGLPATVVLGQNDFTSSDSGISATNMDGPNALIYDAGNKRVYVSDGNNNRIIAYDHIKIATLALPDAIVGRSYAQEIATENDQGTITFSLADGSLPDGMVLGSVDGTPTTPGTYTFTIEASDMVNGSGSLFDDQTYTLVVNPASVPNIAEATYNGGGGGGGSSLPASSPTSATTPSSTPPSTSTPPAPGTPAALQAQISALLAQIAALQAKLGMPAGQGSGSASAGSSSSFTRDLETGMTGPDVKALQVFLNTHGFILASSGPGSPGQETDRFGALTRKALAKFQAAHGISPAAGYFGPKTKAVVSAMLGQ